MKSVNPSTLAPYDKNPRVITKEAIDKVAESIKKHGFVQPIVVNQDNVVCIGHVRLEASKKLNLKKVPVIKVEMDEEKFKKLNLSDNKTSEFSKWDFKELENVFQDLDSNFTLDDTGFNEDEIKSFLLEKPEETQILKSDEDEEGEKKGENYLKLVQLSMTAGEHATFMQQCDALKARFKADTLTETITRAIEMAFHSTELPVDKPKEKKKKATRKRKKKA